MRGSSGAGSESSGRGSVSAGGSWGGGVGEGALACAPLSLYRKDLMGVRSRYTRSESGSPGASVAGVASSGASPCVGKNQGALSTASGP